MHLRKKPLKVDFEDKKKNRAVFGQLTHAAEPEDKVDFLAPEIYLVAGKDFFALVNESNESVDYYVSLGQTSVSGRKAIFQSLVWRDDASLFTGPYRGYSSFAGYVFFEHIFPLSGFLIATDKEQTQEGRAFWMNRLKDAFRQGHLVYVVSDGLVVAEILNFAEVRRLRDDLWAYKSYKVRLAISQHRFPAPTVKL